MKRWVSTGIFVLVAAGTLFGQSAAELEQRYGAKKLYVVGSTVLVRPHFDKLGLICRAEIIPYPVPKDVNGFPRPLRIGYFHADSARLFPSILLNPADVVAAFNELAPPNTRKGLGRTTRDISGFGASYAIGYRYENLTFWMTISRTNRLPMNFHWEGKTFDTAFDSPGGEPVGAVIYWTERTCPADPEQSDWE